jgi:gentisate 1,2-dioxygenase
MTDIQPDSLDALYEELPGFAFQPLWTIKGALTPEPPAQLAPRLWRFADARALLLRAGGLISAEDAERRVLMMRNPALAADAMPCTTDTLWAAIQLVLPGEVAPAHRHTPAALRYIIEGDGAYTLVDGYRVDMAVGDFVITPSGSWHEHGHDGEGPMFWLDGLDLALIHRLNGVFAQFQGRPDDRALPPRALRDHAVRPRAAGDATCPTLVWHLADVEEALRYLVERGATPDPYDGFVVEYRDQGSEGSVMPTLAAEMQLLTPGMETASHRHTHSVVYHVARGTGRSTVGDEVFEWEQGDTFAIPTWVPHAHANLGEEDALLFSYNDRPVMERLDLWRSAPGDPIFRD